MVKMNTDFVIQNNKLIRYSGIETEFIIPDGVFEIVSSAFYGNNKIVSFIMPNTVINTDR